MKKIYLQKLRELEAIVNSVKDEEEKFKVLEGDILKIRKEVDSVDKRTLSIKKQVKREGERNRSMMEIRSEAKHSQTTRAFEDKAV